MPDQTARLVPAALNGEQAAAWEFALGLWRRDPQLKALGVAFRLPQDVDWPKPLPKEDRAWVRLTPSAGAAEGDWPAAVLAAPGKVAYLAPVMVEVETRVPGYLWSNAANVGHLVFKALAPDAPPGGRAAWNAALLAAGISDVEFGPVPGSTLPDEPGMGRLTLVVYATY